MPALDGLKVVRSPIHGYGVITLRRFAAGDIIVYGDGVVYSEDDDFDDTYALLLHIPDEDSGEPQLLLDLTDQTRWINHACDPNTEVDVSWDPDTRIATAWWVALRDIEVGEELTYDYAFSAPLAEPCACGSDSCRGIIVDLDEIDQVTGPNRDLIRPRFRRRLRRRAG
ncbi:SET domain-containing protein [Haliangium sp.]|uniref:SET domain-containing protein n=1 Tax=Haliangium sp. TaxID=2663208 RepID=UPI003D11ABEE